MAELFAKSGRYIGGSMTNLLPLWIQVLYDMCNINSTKEMSYVVSQEKTSGQNVEAQAKKTQQAQSS